MKTGNLIQKTCYLILFLAILFSIKHVAGQENKEEEKIIWKSSSPSKISIHANDSAIIENHNFLYGRCLRFHTGTFDNYVISQKTIWNVGPWEGNIPTLSATALKIKPDGKQVKLWSITEEADTGELTCDYYHTIWYGCCSAGVNHHLYNPDTGILFMEYSRELLSIVAPNSSQKRYIGYKPTETIKINSWEKIPNHIGTLTYSSSQKILHRIALKMIGDSEDKFGLGFANISIEPGSNDQKLGGDILTVWSENSSEDSNIFTNFQIKIVFYDGYTIIIPVKEDNFYFKETKYNDFEIIRIKE